MATYDAAQEARSPWRNDSVTIPCPVCRRPFVPRGRQRVCSAACRQVVWRRRHRTAPAVPALIPERPPRSAIIYECPSCGTQYLGEQRCPDCQQFCRRVGPGGRCPHCDEPVAVAELLLSLPPATTKGGDRAAPR